MMGRVLTAAHRVTVFCLVVCLLLVFLYVIGSYQGFTKESIGLLLSLLDFTAYGSVVGAVSILFAARGAKPSRGRIVVAGLGLLVGSLVFVLTKFVLTLSNPV